jgi:hypothetical protein
VTLRTTVGTETAQQLDSGDTYEIAGQSVATVESVALYPTGDSTQPRVVVELRLRTYAAQGQRLFGATQLQLGHSVPFETDDYGFSGTIVGIVPKSELGDTRTITVTVKLANVQPQVASAVKVGMTESTEEPTYARIADKRVEPAIVILESDDGNIYQREHPRNEDVYLTVELQVRETPSGLQFHGSFRSGTRSSSTSRWSPSGGPSPISRSTEPVRCRFESRSVAHEGGRPPHR